MRLNLDAEISCLSLIRSLLQMLSGGLVDQEALIQALETNQVYGAGLDVYPDEPRIDDRFFTMDNVTLLPHMGTE